MVHDDHAVACPNAACLWSGTFGEATTEDNTSGPLDLFDARFCPECGFQVEFVSDAVWMDLQLVLQFSIGPPPPTRVPCLVCCDDLSVRLAMLDDGESWVFLAPTAPPAGVICFAPLPADEMAEIAARALDARAEVNG